MISTLISLLFLLLVFVVIVWVLTKVPIQEPWRQIIITIFMLLLILVVLRMFGVISF